MKHSTGKPTKAQQARFQALKELGCICCWNYLGIKVAAEIHHLVDKGTRKHSGGHEATLPLCEYHHRGVPFKGCSKDEMEHHYGPSLALRKRAFIEQFGTERQLLETVNAMLERGA